MEKDKVYLKHILDAIEAIESFSQRMTFESFLEDRLVQSGVIRQLEIIGEASKNLSTNFKRFHKDLPWRDITGMRDKLIHAYFSVDLETVWRATKENLPKLKDKILKITKAL